MKKEIEHEYTDEIVCPRCGYTFECSDEFRKDWDRMNCIGCGQIFEYERQIEVTYITKKIKRKI